MLSRTIARFYFFVRRLLVGAERLAVPVLTGVSLGVMGRRTLNAVDDLYHVGGEATRFGPIDYFGDGYNRMGFWAWEEAALVRYFFADGSLPMIPSAGGPAPSGGHPPLAVLAAGGGREVLELRRRGFEVDGWECQPELVRTANRILQQEGFPATVQEAPRDACPEGDRRYGGAIVGWGAYTLVQGSTRRVALLRGLRGRLWAGAPVLLSFFPRRPDERRFRVVARVANILRRATLREAVDLGDFLEPNYVHYFTEDELRRELEQAGFTLEVFEARPYGHAVARAG